MPVTNLPPAIPAAHYSIDFIAGEEEVCGAMAMNPEPEVEPHGRPAEEKSAGTEPPSQNRRRHGSRRPRFRRGPRGDRGGRPAPADQPKPAETQTHHSPSSSGIGGAIEHVERIRAELRHVLDDIQEVLRVLDQAEREKTASEHEIEQLRESLRGLHRDPGHSRHGRGAPPRSAPPPPRDSPEMDESGDDSERI